MEVSNNQRLTPDGGAYGGIGADLRNLRDEQGYSVADAAKALRISARHLLAIEEGRFLDLPGPAYVVGFLRSYASFLGVNPSLVVGKFKNESAYETKSELDFPIPVKETNIPRGSIVWGSLVLAVILVSSWYLVEESRKTQFDEVAAVPKEFSETRNANVAETYLDGDEEPAVGSEKGVLDKQTEGLESIAVGDSEFELEPSDGILAEEIGDQMGSGEISETIGEADVASSAPMDVQSLDLLEGEDTRPSIIPTPPPPPLASQINREPRIYGSENLDSRITLFAIQDSWVQVESADKELLITRILYAGDRYQVPNRRGLTLITGNAGGLKVLVDDAEAPSLGPLGAVRRGILLDPEGLLVMVSGERE